MSELYLNFAIESSDIYDVTFIIAIQLKNSHLTRDLKICVLRLKYISINTGLRETKINVV